MSTLNEHLHGLNKSRNAHGGARPNSGRKKKAETKTISFRVQADKADELTTIIKAIIKNI